MTTLLERLDRYGHESHPAQHPDIVRWEEIRRALAITQAVEKRLTTGNVYQTREAREILDEADELLAKQEEGK